MKTIIALACFLAVANARSYLLPTSQGFNQPSGLFGAGAMIKPGYPMRPSITRPTVVRPAEIVVEEETVEEEASLPCNPNIIGVVVHDEVEEEQVEDGAGSSGSFYPVINRPSVGQQKPAVYPTYPITQQKPAVYPTYPITQQRPAITPTGPVVQQKPAVIRPQVISRPSIVARPQTKPAVIPTGPLTRPIISEQQPAPCVMPEEEQQVVDEELVIVETRPQSRPQILPAVLPPAVSVIGTRPAVQEQEIAQVGVVVEQDGHLRPVYDWIR